MLLNKRFAAAVVASLVLVISAGSPAVAAPSEQDVRFLRQAHQSNAAEIAAGRLAQQKGNSDEIRRLGSRLVADHTRLDDAGTRVAATLKVELPEVSPQQRATARRLADASGADFDALFLSTQLEAHVLAMRLGETELAEGSDATVKKLAADAAPVIAAHHDAIERAGRALGIPTSVDTGTGGTAAPRADRTPGLLLVGLGGLLTLLGAGYLIRTRGRATGTR